MDQKKINYSSIMQKALDLFLEPEHDMRLQSFSIFVDAVASAFTSLKQKKGLRSLGAIVPGTEPPLGSRVFGQNIVLEPTKAAFDLSYLITLVNANDYFSVDPKVSPSVILGPCIAIADYLSKKKICRGQKPISVDDFLKTIIKAYKLFYFFLTLKVDDQKVDDLWILKAVSCLSTMHLMKKDREQLTIALSHLLSEIKFVAKQDYLPHSPWTVASSAAGGLFFTYLVCAQSLQQYDLGDNGVAVCEFNVARADDVIKKNLRFKLLGNYPYYMESLLDFCEQIRTAKNMRSEEIKQITINLPKWLSKKTIYNSLTNQDMDIKTLCTKLILYGNNFDCYESIQHNDLFESIIKKIVIKENMNYTKLYDEDKGWLCPVDFELEFYDGRLVKDSTNNKNTSIKQIDLTQVDQFIDKFETAAAGILPYHSIKKFKGIIHHFDLFDDMPFSKLMDMLVLGHV